MRRMHTPPQFEGEKYCPKCNAPFSIYPACIEGAKEQGICDDCWEYDQPLIKQEGTRHYVPWNYRNHGDGSNCNPEYYEDVYAELPKIKYDKEKGKWFVSFMAPDFGGYDVCQIKWYYDSLDDYYREIMANVEEE